MFPAPLRALSLLVLLMCSTLLSKAAPTNACGVLTPSQIQAVLGVAVGEGQPFSASNPSSCKWQETGVDAFKAKTVIVSIKPVQAYEMGKQLNTGKFTMTPVSGLGEDAYLTSGTLSYGAVISVKKNGGAFTVTVRGFPDVATIAAKDKALAQVASF